jgi:hypothetical protein
VDSFVLDECVRGEAVGQLYLHAIWFKLTTLCDCFGAPACRVFPDHLITHMRR